VADLVVGQAAEADARQHLEAQRGMVGGAARRLDLWPFWEVDAVPALLVRGVLSDVLTLFRLVETFPKLVDTLLTLVTS
jgi:hypothetical protein